MLERLTYRWAYALKRLNDEQTASVEVMQYALAILINVVSIVGLSLLLAAAFGTVASTLLAMIAFALLRALSGGIHLSHSAACIAVSTALFVIIPHFPLGELWCIILTALSIGLVVMFAPSRIEQQSRMPTSAYPMLKLASALLVALNFWLLSDVLALSFFIQSLLLLRKLASKEHLLKP